jgi:hypothetical protein
MKSTNMLSKEKELEPYIEHFLERRSPSKKTAEITKQKEEKRNKKPKPEEHEGMPQHQRCPPTKRRGDRNPKYHEE